MDRDRAPALIEEQACYPMSEELLEKFLRCIDRSEFTQGLNDEERHVIEGIYADIVYPIHALENTIAELRKKEDALKFAIRLGSNGIGNVGIREHVMKLASELCNVLLSQIANDNLPKLWCVKKRPQKPYSTRTTLAM
ncbi:MAG: hypothetical protein G01um101470_974 [Parcubacteria group bacterium Gr01-1014_70]|nr:MAG: hypothetical protein G01um101470_974 [Parcubacteria group bacterium Gr01-1014_70]